MVRQRGRTQGIGAPQVALAFPRRQTRLGPGGPYPLRQAWLQGDAQGVTQRAADLQGLVETAFRQAATMQGDGQDDRRSRTVQGRQRLRQQLAQQPAHGQVLVELEALDQVIEGRGVAEGRDHPVEGRGLLLALAAQLAVAGQRQGAAHAGRPQPGQVGMAAGAEIPASRPGTATQPTARREQRVL